MSQTLMETNLKNQYMPDVVTAPGETLQEVLGERQMTQTELAERLGLSHKTVNEIIRGKAPITYTTALSLEIVLGIPANFWNAYETSYREFVTRNEVRQKLSEYALWLNRLPWKKAIAKGWLEQTSSPVEQLMNVLRYFGVASPEQYDEVYGNLAVQWRRSTKWSVDPHAAAFWIRRGELMALELISDPSIAWSDYSETEFEKCLYEARALTLNKEPSSFVPELQRICARAGVAIVFVQEIEGVRAGGAARWLSSQRAIIQLSLRYSWNDAFWFHFYHEAGHIIKHPKKVFFIEHEGQAQDVFEREANEFAQNTMVPSKVFEAFIGSVQGKPTEAMVKEFAQSIGVDAGIVVGRLQNEGRLLRNQLNHLKHRYKWPDQ